MADDPGEPHVIKESPFRGLIRADVPTEVILKLVKAFHEGRFPPGSQKLSDHDGKYESYFVPLPDPPGEVLFKHFSHQRLSRLVWPVVGISKAMHCWRIAERLREEPCLTSSPVAAVERRARGMVRDSYFMAEWIQPGTSFIEAAAERIVAGERTRDDVYQELAELMAELHRRDIYHSGLHAGNILAGPGGLLMIDLDAAAFRPRMTVKDRMRMLFDAFEYFLMVAEPTDFRELVECYARTMHAPMDALRSQTASAIKRLRKKRDKSQSQSAAYREERLIKCLVWPASRPIAIREDDIPSWEGLLDKLRSRGLVSAVWRNRYVFEDTAPEEWLVDFDTTIKEERAEADEALGRLHEYAQSLTDAGIRPLLIGTLPLLQHYSHPLGVAALAPFEIVVRPDDMPKAADLLKHAGDVDVLLGDNATFDGPEGQLRLSAEWLMADAEEFDFCALPLRTPHPERAFIYHAVRCVAPRIRARAHTALDFAVFLTSCTEGVEADAIAELTRKLSAESLLWNAIRRIRLLSRSPWPAVEELARALASLQAKERRQ